MWLFEVLVFAGVLGVGLGLGFSWLEKRRDGRPQSEE